MASVTPLLRLLKLIVRSKAKTLPSGEKVIGVCLFLRLLVVAPAVLIGYVIWDNSGSPGRVEEPLGTRLFGMGVAVFYVAAVLAVWWQKLVWKGDTVGVRSIFRMMKKYTWNDLKTVRGSRKSWVVRMADGRKFRGNEWTNGAQEFLELVRIKTGVVLPDY